MGVAIRFPTANETTSNPSWTNPNNAHADDGVNATAALGANSAAANRWTNFGFDGVIPVNSVITAVTIRFEAYEISFGEAMSAFAVVRGVDQPLHYSSTATTLATYAWNITSDRLWTREDLLDSALKIFLRADGNETSSTSYTLDYLQVEVEYGRPLRRPGILRPGKLA